MALGLYDITPLEPLIAQGYTLLTPNFRLARRIKAEWDARQLAAGQGTWEPAPVLALETWVQRQWDGAVSRDLLPPRVLLTPAQSLEVWRQVIGLHQRRAPQTQLLRPSGAAELAAQARDSILRWQIDCAAPLNRALFELEGDCCTFLQWLELFEERLQRQGLCTPVDCLVQLSGIPPAECDTRVALLEFDLLAPLVRTVLDRCCSDVQEVAATRGKAQCLVHPFDDRRSELHAVARWVADSHRQDSVSTIAIVLGDMGADRVPLEYLLRREFRCLGRDYGSLPVNFSTGITLDQAPLVRDALAVLAMGLQDCPISAVEGLLRSRFLDLPDAPGPLAQRFIRQLHAEGRAVLPVSDIRNAARAVQRDSENGLSLGRYLDNLRATPGLRQKALPSVWRRRFSDILHGWGWPGTQALDTLEFQQQALWRRTLDEFGDFDTVCEPLQFHEALALLRGCCASQVSQPQTADSPIQVLGPLEAAGLSFDHLWLCGMQGASWPASPRPNPFIPIALQTRLQMPHASPERERVFAEALLNQYTRTNTVIHASYCRQLDGVPDLPSSLLQDFCPQPIPAPAPIEAGWQVLCDAASLEELADERVSRLEPEPHQVLTGGSRLLEDQSQCPFRAFVHHRLQVEPLGSLTVALSTADRGSLLHQALHNLWADLCDSATLQALDETQEAQRVKSAVQAAVSGVPHHLQRRLGAAYWRLEASRLNSLLREWLQLERQRSEFFVAARELDMTLALGPLHVSLRVDRIDELPDGSRVIIDYKSGKSTVLDWMGDRPARPQLLLYSIADPGTVAALAFATVRPRDCRFSGLGTTAAAPGIATRLSGAGDFTRDAGVWGELNAQWKRALERIANEYVGGEAQVDPLTPASCDWCGLQSLCRIEFGRDDTVAALEDGAQ